MQCFFFGVGALRASAIPGILFGHNPGTYVTHQRFLTV
jgi:hypothetical protein